MFALKPKSKEYLEKVINLKTFVIKCFGCKEVFFPEEEIDLILLHTDSESPKRLDYLCREEFSAAYLEKYGREIKRSSNLVVFSCGTGVQTIAKILDEKEVLPGCDTFYLNGFQGLRALPADCLQCGECRLNFTGGICPLTACSKSLINGQCGGASGGKCEVNSDIDCGWEAIYKKLSAAGGENILKAGQQPRDFSKMILEDLSTGEEKK